MAQHVVPQYERPAFTCMHCGVLASQYWTALFYRGAGGIHGRPGISMCTCHHCDLPSFWTKDALIHPDMGAAPFPHPDMPKKVAEIYNEARSVFSKSPKAAAALLRLVIQELMPTLGGSGKDLHKAIGDLVKDGLPEQVQQALDYCRVIGNNAVHPGEINLSDSPEMAERLFEFINMIVEDRIARPRRVREMYEKLPAGARAAIEKRDGVQQPADKPLED